ncbi:MAG: class I SAM-dependent methyltransferase [Armatimonadota bacterium]|nr:class I SAM-dependent methyltransferase [Armatimonadota bacterium]
MSSVCVLCGSETQAPILTGPDRLLGLPGVYTVVRCRGCGLGRTEPQIPPEERAKYYAPEEGGEAGKADRIAMYQSRTAALVDRAAPPGKNRRVLDIGCGEGIFLDLMRGRGWEVSGVELGAESSRVAREDRGLDVTTGNLSDLRAEPGSFEAIVMSHVLEHLSDPMEQLRRVGELLAPGGLLWLSLPNYGSLEARLFRGNWYNWALPPHLFHFNVGAAYMAVGKVGLRVDRITYLPFFSTAQSLRYALKRGALVPAVTPAASDQTVHDAGKDKLKSIIFRTILTVSHLLGKFLPGEIMEIQARKP